jgi:hypothetical protein
VGDDEAEAVKGIVSEEDKEGDEGANVDFG